MKAFVWTFLAVFAGIFAYSKLTSGKKKGAPSSTGVLSTGEADFDPVTGAQITSGNGPGTVGFVSSSIDNFGNLPNKL